jgi:Tat protein translocase TatB subunit
LTPEPGADTITVMNFGLGYSEIAVILVVALIVIGPRKLPQLLRDIGRIMGQVRRTSDELRREILFADDFRDLKKSVRDAVDPTRPPPIPPRLKVKPDAAPAAASGEDDWKNHPAYQDPDPAPETPNPDQGTSNNDG